MTKILFSDLSLTPKVARAIDEMGFDFATPVQSAAIPLIRTGVDVIAKSQTGTGKTVAFAIPAIEKIDTHEEKPTIQVLILCPTRELAQQADSEIRKLVKFKSGVNPVAIYGGAPMDRQCIRLRRANLIIGTPGRVMDHMRRKTIKLGNLKMIVLDEADEMLNMGFREDIETILTDTPDTRQTILFSATMPPEIVKLAKQFQKDAQLIEIDKSQVTIGNIKQSYLNVPSALKTDALVRLMKFHQPKRTIIFCNTKKMADELTGQLKAEGFSAESIHSDVKQSQRTATMQSFKLGKLGILVATDIAARGIDVSDIEYVINYDLPQNTEYYVHRIGRTGRAGKFGSSITLCSGNRQIAMIKHIALAAKSTIEPMALPSSGNLRSMHIEQAVEKMEGLLAQPQQRAYEELVAALTEKGYTPERIAEAALQLSFDEIGRCEEEDPLIMQLQQAQVAEQKKHSKNRNRAGHYSAIVINIGTANHIAPNHIVGALAERTPLSHGDIGKIKVLADQTVVDIPTDSVDEVVKAMKGCKIHGICVKTAALADKIYRSGHYPAKRPYKTRRDKRS